MKYTSNEQSVSWFRERFREGTLTLRPPFQRKAVWRLRQKCALIESLLMGYPVPEVFIQRITDEEGNTEYGVIDGQQRIRTILEFIGLSDAVSGDGTDEYLSFSLSTLGPSSPWHGKTFRELSAEERASLFDYQIAVRNISDPDEAAVKDMFRRLNKYTVALNAQELRNATYEGPFAQRAESLAEKHADFLAENRVLTASSIRRMGDVEFLADLMIGSLYGPTAGNAATIDENYAEFEDYEEAFPRERQTVALIDRAFARLSTNMEDLRNTRWSNKTDFYTLFVALVTLDKLEDPLVRDPSSFFKAAAEFGAAVEYAQENPEEARAASVARYVDAVGRGVNDKARRAARQTALLEWVRQHAGWGDQSGTEGGGQGS